MLYVFLQHGWTPLHFAAYNNRVKVVQYLNDNDAKIESVNKVSIQLCITQNIHGTN